MQGICSQRLGDDLELVGAVLNGDEAAFATLVDRYSPAMLRIAALHVTNRAVAEEVVQETWLAVFRSLARFEGRSSLKTWLFVILVNCAKRRAAREARSVPFSGISSVDADLADADPDVDRFLPAGHRWAGCWSTVVVNPDALPEQRLLSSEVRTAAQAAAAALPPAQRAVFMLRDIAGWNADEVCNALQISDSNQRVLLHRARTKLRHALEPYLTGARS